MNLSEDFLNELRLRCDIVSIISQYVVLKKQSRSYVGLCPFHSEKTPSFHVSPDKQLFYCFGCQTGGDVVTFIMKIENLSYIEAVTLLAEKAGLTIDKDEFDDSELRLKNRIFEINRETARFYNKALCSQIGRGAYEYISKRGLTEKTITHFGLGYAPDEWDALIRHLRQKGYSDAEMISANVALTTKKGNIIDFFRNRLMFPIIDLRGNVIAFGGRKLSEQDNGPKYMNTSDTPVYSKNRNLYAMNFAKTSAFCQELSKSGKDRFFILCEGYMDVISMHQAGFDNAVAPLGTALTENQVRLISKYVDSVIIATDSDKAGRKAAKRSFSLIDAAGLNTKILKIEGAKDPDEYIKKYGAERFARLLSQSVNAAEDEIDAILKKYDTSTDSGKIQALKEASSVLSDISNPIERDVYILRLSRELSVSSQAVSQNVNNLIRQKALNRRRQENRNLSVQNGVRDNVNTEKRTMLSAAVCEEWLLGALFSHPDFYSIAVKNGIEEQSFVTSWGKKMFSVISNELEKGTTLDLMAIGPYITSQEMSRMAQIITKDGSYINTKEQFLELIASLKSEKTQRSLSKEEIGNLDDQSLAELIEKLAQDKK